MRRALIAANWKMNKTVEEALRFVSELKGAVKGARVEMAVIPSFTSLYPVAEMLSGTGIRLGAQDLFWEREGAFTGEVSPLMLKDVGCHFVIIGHSERRHTFGETNDMVRKKVEAALEHELVPILCVGEREEERDEGRTFQILEDQLEAALKGIPIGSPQHLVIAYEPVWAIGTGRTATPEQAQEAQGYIRGLLAFHLNSDMAHGVRILYGGSVRPDNIAELISMPDVDGALVGGASLDIKSFIEIVLTADRGG